MSRWRGERIPVYRPVLTDDDALAVAASLRDGWVSGTSPRVAELERELARRCGAKHGAATSSGTAALEIALRALEIGPGDEVLCPSLTIISCARAILAVGATPVLVDVSPTTWCLDVEAALARVGPRTRAVLAVHLLGWPVELEALLPLRRDGIFVVEDAAQALGSEVRVDGAWRRCGGVGDLAAFSFYANKAITTGEGGMVVGSDPALVDRARQTASLFFGREERFRHEELGLGARMNGLGAALGLSQLSRLDEILGRKRAIAATYREALSDLDSVSMASTPDWARPVPWMVAITTPLPARDVIAALDECAIEARPFFVGMHRQPALAARGVEPGGRFPRTDHLSAHGLYLPSSLSLTEAEIARVTGALRDVLHGGAGTGPFGEAYARHYDAIYGAKPYQREARAIHDLLVAESDAPPRRVLDLGCGTGRHAQALAALGLEITAVDRSPEMIARARTRCEGTPGIELVVQAIGELDLDGEPHDAALLLFNVLGYLGGDDEVVRSLSRVRRHLRPGALLVADAWDREAVLAEPPVHREQRFASERGAFVREALAEHAPEESSVRVRYRIRDEGGGARAEELHALRYFSEDRLRDLLGRAGLELLRFAPWPELGVAEGRRDYTAYLVGRAV